jgi:hypothetical protein
MLLPQLLRQLPKPSPCLPEFKIDRLLNNPFSVEERQIAEAHLFGCKICHKLVAVKLKQFRFRCLN